MQKNFIYMMCKNLLRTISLGGMATILLTQTTTVTQASVEVNKSIKPLAANLIANQPSPEAEKYSVSGKAKIKKGDYQGALADYNRVVQLEPNLALAYGDRAFLKAEKLQDYRGALSDINRAIQLDPKLAVAYHYRGNLKAAKLHDVRGGIADITRAIQLNPKLAKAYYDRGFVKAAVLRDLKGGLTDFNRAVELEPNNVDFVYFRGLLKIELNDVRGGMTDLDRAVQISPDNPVVFDGRALRRYSLLKDRTGAITDMKQAIKLYRQRGQIQFAEAAAEQVRKWQQTMNDSGSMKLPSLNSK